MDRYIVEKQIGQGSFGSVFLCVKRHTKERRAVKRIMGRLTDWKQLMSIREVQFICAQQHHPNLVTTYEIMQQDHHLYIVMEYCDSGSLHDVMQRARQHNNNNMSQQQHALTLERIQDLVRQLTAGLAHMHKLKYIHRDIKPENLLLSGNTLKVADFSLARRIGGGLESSPQTSYCSTRWYRAPEVLLCCQHYGCPMDVWAVGCVAAELFRLEPLWPGHCELDQWNRIVAVTGTPTIDQWPAGVTAMVGYGMTISGSDHYTQEQQESMDWQLRQQLPDTTPQPAIHLMGRMLELNPASRITAATAVEQHEYLLDNNNNNNMSSNTNNMQRIPVISSSTSNNPVVSL